MTVDDMSEVVAWVLGGLVLAVAVLFVVARVFVFKVWKDILRDPWED